MPKIVTREGRIVEVRSAAHGLATAIATATAAESDPSNSEAEVQELWADVATRCGAIQRRTRQLAGLGRGG